MGMLIIFPLLSAPLMALASPLPATPPMSAQTTHKIVACPGPQNKNAGNRCVQILTEYQ